MSESGRNQWEELEVNMIKYTGFMFKILKELLKSVFNKIQDQITSAAIIE